MAFRQQRGGLRLNGDYFDALIAAFEVLPHTAYRAASTHSRDEDIDLAGGVLPNFRAGRYSVRGRVCRVFKLAENERAGYLGFELFRLFDRSGSLKL